jgi:ADP-L-glycero-D-manno-heptose 6-epimerase
MILITGAAGFIGINTVLSLNQQGIKNLILVDHFELEEKNEKLKLFQYHKSLLINDCEVLLKNNIDLNIDVVIHLGAITDTTCNDSELLKKLNVDFSKKIWDYCTKNDIKLIYASSGATYGIGDKGFDDDEKKIPELQPLNKYGKSKNDFDLWAINQSDSPSSWVGLKFFNVYGPYEDNKGNMASPVHWGLRKVYNEKNMHLFKSLNPKYEDGYQTRDFIFVGDIISVILFFKDKKNVGIFNVGTGNPQSFLALAKTLFNALNIPEKIIYIDMPKNLIDIYQYYTAANIKKLRSVGYTKEFTSLKDGVRICKDYFLGNIK